MPYTYKRKSSRGSWSKEDMAKAVEAVKKKEMGWLKAANTFNVPQATLRRHFTKIPTNLGRFKPTFYADLEKDLVSHILDFESRLFGFTTTDIRKLAYQLAEKTKINHSFNKQKEMAGWDWLKGFRERHPEISLRAPEPTSAARARAFNKPQVQKFFVLLEKVLSEEGIPPQRIYNMDESGLTTVQKPSKILAQKGKKQVGALTSAERGQHVTVAVCGNAAGNLIPPTLIIPRKNFKHEYFDGAPPGTLKLCYETGYMVGELFFKWMQHFVSSVGCNPANKVLLILDGHASHKNLDALEYAKTHGVIPLCLPPHCTHRMQPLDVSFFAPLDAYYNREATLWLKNHPGRTIGLYQVSEIFGRAYGSAASVGNVTSGFEKSGIYPLNPNIFPDYLYLPSAVTENETKPDKESHKNIESSDSPPTDVIPIQYQPENVSSQSEVPGCSSSSLQLEVTGPTPSGFSQAETVKTSCTKELLHKLSPFPTSVSSGKVRNNKKKSSGSQILTSTPFMDEIKSQIEAKNEKLNRKSLRERKQVKRVLFDHDEEEESQLLRQEDQSDDADDVSCIYCNELYKNSKPKEYWVKCQCCSNWCHTQCAGVSDRVKAFTCELCI